MVTLVQVKVQLVEPDKVKIARVIVLLITLLGLRETVKRMLN